MQAEQIRAIIEEIAADGETIQYGELMKQVGLSHSNHGQRAQFGMTLRQICAETYEENGFMLCAIVVSKASGIPSEPFFNKAKELGAMNDNGNEQEFFEDQKKKVFEFYG